MYVGRAIEFNDGGFEKRLTDERKSLASARQHKSGQFIYEHLDQITTDILVVGETQEDVRLTKVLEGKFIARFRPPWNKQSFIDSFRITKKLASFEEASFFIKRIRVI